MGKTYIADKETLDKCYAILSADGIYGFIEHMDVLSPTARIEYIGQNKDFTPISLNKDTGTMTLNSWADFPIIVANKPWMVRADGTPDYRLDENDYTKKEDGTASDVSNTSYNGGAFSWLAKIYKQEYMLGNDRVVKFSMRERDGFEPVGFKDPNNNVLEGVWIPMFYGSILGADTSTPKMVSLAGLQPCYNNTTDKEHTAIANFSSRAAFLGGGIVQTITDLLIMFAKSTNSQEAYGYGNSSGYDASLAPTNGVKQNAVVGGGQFYGTKDAKSLNKIFHSIVLGTYQQWMRDPYTLLVNGRYKVSKNYTYDVTGATYHNTGIVLPTTDQDKWDYPSHYTVVPGFGAVAIEPFNGSTVLGGCDGVYYHAEGTKVGLRFGYCHHGTDTGPRCINLTSDAGWSNWDLGSAILLLPPVGVAV